MLNFWDFDGDVCSDCHKRFDREIDEAVAHAELAVIQLFGPALRTMLAQCGGEGADGAEWMATRVATLVPRYLLDDALHHPEAAGPLANTIALALNMVEAAEVEYNSGFRYTDAEWRDVLEDQIYDLMDLDRNEVDEEEADVLEQLLPAPRIRYDTYDPQRARDNARRNGARANQRRHEDAQKVLAEAHSPSATFFAFTMIVTGFAYHEAAVMASFFTVRPPPSSTYFLAQGKVLQEFEYLARFNVGYARARLLGDIALSFDAGWAHARRSSQCSGCFFAHGGNLDRPRIIDFDYTNFYRGNQPDAAVACQALEGIIFKDMATRARAVPGVKWLVHDRDAKASKILSDGDWTWIELLDKNHVVKGYEGLYDTHGTVQPASKPGAKRKANRIDYLKRVRLKRWFFTCINSGG
jgi:hypothetical protein